jgi:hypothetical protein
MRSELAQWSVWLILIIIWNFGFPAASPIQDVLIAVVLSIIFIYLKKIKK